MNTAQQLEIIEKAIDWHFRLLQKLIDEDADAQYTLIAETILKLQQVKRNISPRSPQGM